MKKSVSSVCMLVRICLAWYRARTYYLLGSLQFPVADSGRKQRIWKVSWGAENSIKAACAKDGRNYKSGNSLHSNGMIQSLALWHRKAQARVNILWLFCTFCQSKAKPVGHILERRQFRQRQSFAISRQILITAGGARRAWSNTVCVLWQYTHCAIMVVNVPCTTFRISLLFLFSFSFSSFIILTIFLIFHYHTVQYQYLVPLKSDK